MNDLRDKFAKAALQGLLSNSGVFCGEDRDWSEFCATLSEECYDLADAMLVAREKGVANLEKPALDKTLHYSQWRRGDVLRVLSVGLYDPFVVGTLVEHVDLAGSQSPVVEGAGVRGRMSSGQLEFVSRP